MDFRDYQEAAARTAGQHSDDNLEIMNHSMGLAGETGELVDMLKKKLFHGRPATKKDLESEAGDVLWYLSNLCRTLGISLQRVAENNLLKLQRRYPNGFVKGGGIREAPEKCQQVYWHAPTVTKFVRCGHHSSELGYVWLCPNHYRETKVGKAVEKVITNNDEALRKLGDE